MPFFLKLLIALKLAATRLLPGRSDAGQLAGLTLLAEGAPVENKEFHRAAEVRSIVNAAQILGTFATNRRRIRLQLDQILTICERSGATAIEAIEQLGLDFDAPLLAVLGMLLLRRKEKRRDHDLFNLTAGILIGDIRPKTETEDWLAVYQLLDVLQHIIPAIEAIPSAPLEQYAAARLQEKALTLSHWLASQGRVLPALHLLFLAVNALYGADPLLRLGLARGILECVMLGTSMPVKAHALKCIVILCIVLEKTEDPKVSLAMIDLLYDVLLQVSEKALGNVQRATILGPYIKHGRKPSMVRLYKLSHPGLIRGEYVGNLSPLKLVRLLPTVVRSRPAQWAPQLLPLNAFLSSLEDDRLACEPREDSVAATEWSSHTFRVPAFLRSVPLSGSFLMLQDCRDVLLVLKHEIVHSLCMGGLIGLTLSALRTAFTQLESKLQLAEVDKALKDPVREDAVSLFGKKVIHNERNLARAAAQVECMRKIQIIQEVWEPWFEGVAVFTELHAIPSDVTDTWGAWNTALLAIRDLEVPWGTDAHERLSISMAWSKEFESFSEKVAEHDGYYRLRAYLVPHRAKYLAGYLAVRAVVSSWRAQIGAELPGEVAARLLIAATQFTLDLPNLDLDIDAFERATLAAMLKWVADISNWSASTLRASMPGTADDRMTLSMVDVGKTVCLTIAPKGLSDQVSRLVRRCTAAVNVADDWGSKAGGATPDFLRGITRSNRSQSFLPLGESHAPFWLHSGRRLALVLIRTGESGGENGAMYRWITLQLSKSESMDLESQIRIRRESRVRVLRLVDVTAAGQDDQRVYGIHYLAFIYGSSLIVRNSALAANGVDKHGSVPQSLIDDILLRYMNPEVQLDQEVIGDEWLSPAARISHWLSAQEWKDVQADLRKEISVNARRTVRVARGSRSLDVNAALLSTQFAATGMVDALIKDGVETFIPDDADGLEGVLRTMHESGRTPSLVDQEDWRQRCLVFEIRDGRCDVRRLKGHQVGGGA